MARVRIFWRSANAWPPNLVFEKLFSKRKKSFKLKLRENSDYYRDEKNYFQKKFKWLFSEKCEKIPIESTNLQKKNIYTYTVMFLKLCAVKDLQVCRKCF